MENQGSLTVDERVPNSRIQIKVCIEYPAAILWTRMDSSPVISDLYFITRLNNVSIRLTAGYFIFLIVPQILDYIGDVGVWVSTLS